MTTPYRRGADEERRCMAVLAAEGWPILIRSAGSLGVVDVLATSPAGLLVVQVKRGTGAFLAERRRSGALPLPPDGRAELWVYAPRQGFRRLPALPAVA